MKIMEEQSEQKRTYLNAIVGRYQRHSANRIGQIMVEAFEKGKVLNLAVRSEVYAFLCTLEMSLLHCIETIDIEVEQKLTIARNEGGKNTDWHFPTHVGTPVREVSPEIVRYNQQFSRNTKSPEPKCSICEEEIDETMVCISHCGHSLCSTCFQQYVNVQIRSNAYPISCFSKNCRVILEETDLNQANLTQEDIQMWRDQTRLHLPNTIKCPGYNCSEVLFIEDQDELLCPSCSQDICTRCGAFTHKTTTCQEARIISRRVLSGDHAFEQLIKAHIVQHCPQCGAPAIRNDGCPDMVCGSCKAHWKYIGEYRIDDDL
jgi:hypothetical protein